MREIKFRAWDKKHKIFTLISLGMTFGRNGTTNKVFMQFTGLKDKNGKEIYEGDVVKSRNNFISVVEFLDGMFWAETSGVYDKGFNEQARRGDIEVIGNIYENLELLEEKK